MVLLCAHHQEKYRTYATPGICHSETSGEFKIGRVHVIKWCYYVPIIRRNTVPMRHLVFVTLKQVESLKLQGSNVIKWC